jgi:hypothetical protein
MMIINEREQKKGVEGGLVRNERKDCCGERRKSRTDGHIRQSLLKCIGGTKEKMKRGRGRGRVN